MATKSSFVHLRTWAHMNNLKRAAPTVTRWQGHLSHTSDNYDIQRITAFKQPVVITHYVTTDISGTMWLSHTSTSQRQCDTMPHTVHTLRLILSSDRQTPRFRYHGNPSHTALQFWWYRMKPTRQDHTRWDMTRTYSMYSMLACTSLPVYINVYQRNSIMEEHIHHTSRCKMPTK